MLKHFKSLLLMSVLIACVVSYNTAILLANPLLEAANKANIAKKYQQAIFLYEKSIQNGANKAIVYFNLGNIYFHLDNHGKAIVYYKKVIEIAPQFKDSYLNLGKILYLKDEYIKSLNTFKRYNEINPDDVETLMLVGDVYNKLQQFHLAERNYLRVVKLDTENEAARTALISLYYDLKDYRNALDYTTTALTYLPNNINLLEMQADIHRQLKEYHEASAVYSYMLSSLTNIDKEDKYRLYYQMVDNYYEGGFTNMAIYTLQETLKEYPSEQESYDYIVYLWLLNDRGIEALEFFIDFYSNNKTQSYLAIKQIFTRAYNNNNVDLIKKTIAFYQQQGIKDDLYQIAIASFGEGKLN